MSRTANFPSIGTLNTTLPSPGDPTYQVESLALDLHKIIKDLSDNSFEFQQAVAGDFTTFGGGVQDALDNYMDRYEDFLQTGASAVSAALPDVLPIIAAVLSGGGEGVIAILLQGVLDTMLRHKDTRTNHYDGDTAEVDLSDVIAALEDIRDRLTDDTTSITERLEEVRQQIEQTLDEFNINVINSYDDAFFSVGPPAD
jgi:hypothetical protein